MGWLAPECRESKRDFFQRMFAMAHDESGKIEGLSLLGGGAKTDYPDRYAPEVLEFFGNKFPEHEYVVELLCPEFTSLCPITGQPDFGRIVIRYSPAALLVESKSLKIYLFSFRNHGSFHENCVNMIARDLFNGMKPKWIEVSGYFNPRGGISINPSVRLAS